MFKQQFIIVDDFYPDPFEVRNMALSIPMSDQSKGNYAGTMSMHAWFTDEHRQILTTLTNEPVDSSGGLNGYFRYTQGTDTMTQYIHFDPKPRQCWAGLVHLSDQRNIDQHGSHLCGTKFWRHKRTGLECIPMTQEGIELYGWKNGDDLKQFLETEGTDEDLWSETFNIPARFNRLVLFRPWHFHSPGSAFGDSLATCRLVQLFFLSL